MNKIWSSGIKIVGLLEIIIGSLIVIISLKGILGGHGGDTLIALIVLLLIGIWLYVSGRLLLKSRFLGKLMTGLVALAIIFYLSLGVFLHISNRLFLASSASWPWSFSKEVQTVLDSPEFLRDVNSYCDKDFGVNQKNCHYKDFTITQRGYASKVGPNKYVIHFGGVIDCPIPKEQAPSPLENQKTENFIAGYYCASSFEVVVEIIGKQWKIIDKKGIQFWC